MRVRNTLFMLLGLSILSYLLYTFQTLVDFTTEPSFFRVHITLNIFSILVCFMICLYGWQFYRENHTLHYYVITPLFFTIGFFYLLHTLALPRVADFASEAGTGLSVWFLLLARITESVGVFILLLYYNKVIKPPSFKRYFSGTIVSIFSIAAMLYLNYEKLPVLFMDGKGPTYLNISIESVIAAIGIITVGRALWLYKKIKDSRLVDISIALLLFLFSGLFITLQRYYYDIAFLTAHTLILLGLIYFLKVYFLSNVQLNFQNKLKADENLMNTQELLYSFMKQSPDSINIMNPDGVIIYVNPAFEKLFGWKREEAIGKKLNELMTNVPKEDYQYIEEAAYGKSISGYESIRFTKEGRMFYSSSSVSPVKNYSGKIIYIAAITRDITERVEIQEHIKRTEAHFRDAIRNQQGIILKFKKEQEKFIHTLFDGELTTKLNIKPERIIGKTIYDIVYKKDKADYITNYYEEAWKGKEVSFELKIGTFFLFIALRPIRQQDTIVEVVGSCVDITELKQTQLLLQKSEKLAVVGELAASFAHEIRNPLTTLKGFTQILLGSNDLQESRPHLQLMLDELDRIDMITNEFMVAAKPQAIRYEEHNLKDILAQVTMFLQPLANLNNVQLSLHYDMLDELNLYCDKNQIKQVFINLIKNSIEAIHDGGDIELFVYKEKENHITVQIKDTGIGIPKHILPRLGEPFYTLKEKGTGLGLMVSFRIIEAHNGVIHFESSEGVGTTVKVTLPIYHELKKIKQVYSHS